MDCESNGGGSAVSDKENHRHLPTPRPRPGHHQYNCTVHTKHVTHNVLLIGHHIDEVCDLGAPLISRMEGALHPLLGDITCHVEVGEGELSF